MAGNHLTTASTEVFGQAPNDPLVDEFGNFLTDEDTGTITPPPPPQVDAPPLILAMRMMLFNP